MPKPKTQPRPAEPERIRIGERAFELRAVPFALAERLGSLPFARQITAIAEPLTERAIDEEPVTEEWLREHLSIPDVEAVVHRLQYGHLHAQFLMPSQMAAQVAEGDAEGN